jgi:uncharacterized membrane protein
MSDNVFAFAMTLLVLSISVPVVTDPSNREMAHALGDRAKEFAIYLASFGVVGTFWLRHHRFTRRIAKADGRFQALNLAYLAAIAFMPYPTKVLGDYDDGVSLTLYALSVSAVLAMALLLGEHAARAGLMRLPESPRQAALRRAGLLMPMAVFLISVPLALTLGALAGYAWWVVGLSVGSVARRLAAD